MLNWTTYYISLKAKQNLKCIDMNVPPMFNNLHIENEPVNIPLPSDITLTIKREDKNHPFVSGNKLRKLKYNIAKAQDKAKIPSSLLEGLILITSLLQLLRGKL